MSKRIMIIDDSPTIRALLRVYLRREGFEVLDFRDGPEMLYWWKTRETWIPDLVFLDMTLPHIGGLEVMKRMRSLHGLHQTIFVIIHHRDSAIKRMRALLAGADDYLSKPLTIQQIQSTLRTHLQPLAPLL